jgi:hypothetical protein
MAALRVEWVWIPGLARVRLSLNQGDALSADMASLRSERIVGRSEKGRFRIPREVPITSS